MSNHTPRPYVVELDDPSEFPTPTWGPFDTAALAEAWVERWLLAGEVVVAKLRYEHDVTHSYELADGRLFTIKQLTPPN